MSQLQDQIIVITGASSGIGKGMAKLFGREGAKLALCARNEEKLHQTSEELQAEGIDVLAVPTDVSSEEDVKRLIDRTGETYGRIDVLVNNAGTFDGGPLEEVTLSAWENVIGACMTGTFLCSRAVFPIMKQQKGGRILNIGSISAQRSREEMVPYTAAKFGVWGMTQAIALEGRPFNIVCSCLHPGNVRVERRENTDLDSDDEPMMSVETIARAALSMITLPLDVNFLEAIVLPTQQEYLGRG